MVDEAGGAAGDYCCCFELDRSLNRSIWEFFLITFNLKWGGFVEHYLSEK